MVNDSRSLDICISIVWEERMTDGFMDHFRETERDLSDHAERIEFLYSDANVLPTPTLKKETIRVKAMFPPSFHVGVIVVWMFCWPTALFLLVNILERNVNFIQIVFQLFFISIFDNWLDLSLNGDGYLFIADQWNHWILGSGPWVFRCVTGCSGEGGSASNQLWYPPTRRFDSDGNLLVLNTNNNRVQKFLLTRTSCNCESKSNE